MSNYIMNIDFFANTLRCETEDMTVSLNDLFACANHHRYEVSKAPMQLRAFETAVKTKEYIAAASKSWSIPEDKLLYKVGRGNKTRTMAHISVALLAAEQVSVEFHVQLHKTLIEGKLLEFRDYGGSEFKKLNVNIDAYLPGREGKSNNGIYINSAKLIRTKLLGENAKTEDWNQASVSQTHSRYDIENKLSSMLSLGVVRDYDHLKELIGKI